MTHVQANTPDGASFIGCHWGQETLDERRRLCALSRVEDRGSAEDVHLDILAFEYCEPDVYVCVFGLADEDPCWLCPWYETYESCMW